MNSPLRARYIGYTEGTENHGDEALIGIIRQLLAPELEVITEGEDYDVALLGGGTLINQSPWLIDYFRGALDKARAGIVFGAGVGDTLFWGDNFARWKPLLERCRFVYVRGEESARLLEGAGIACTALGDPYLALQPVFPRLPIEKRLGINFGSTNNALLGGGTDGEYIAVIEKVLTILKSRGWNFSWLSVWSRDTPIMAAVRDRLGGTSPIIDARSETIEAFAALSRSQLFLGEKLHACAMAAVAGTPFIALEYQPKVREFAESVSMNDFCLSTAERDPARIIEAIEDLAANPRDALIAASVRDARERIHKAARLVRTTLFNELGSAR